MKEQSKWISGKGVLFVALFSLAVLIADQIKITAAWGAANQYFTAFQFMGPIAGGFLGPVVGAISVLFAELISFLYLGKELNLLNVLRLAPMLFATLYFASFGAKKVLKGNYVVLVPIFAMLLFILHPVGSQAWYYSLYWLIPVIAAAFFSKNLFARSLGSTFTAHAIGGVIWLYTIPTTPEFWVALIPIVALERVAYALGISISFAAFNSLLAKVESRFGEGFLEIDRRYSIFGKPQPVKSRK